MVGLQIAVREGVRYKQEKSRADVTIPEIENLHRLDMTD
jgi:hypothetical protein